MRRRLDVEWTLVFDCADRWDETVHITANCPGCNRRYQLNPELVGQQMRCPNPSCRVVFAVQAEEAEPEPPPAEVTEQPGEAVGYLGGGAVPILPAEPEGMPDRPAGSGDTWYATAHVQDRPPVLPADPNLTPLADRPVQPPPSPPQEEPTDGGVYSGVDHPAPYPVVRNWSDEPPPPRPRPPARNADIATPPPEPPFATEVTPVPAKPKRTTVRQSKADTAIVPVPSEPRQARESHEAPAPIELPSGSWSAPPVRSPVVSSPADGMLPAESRHDETEIHHDHTEAPRRSRGTRAVVLGALGFMTVVAAVVVVIVFGVLGKSEKSAHDQAKKAYDQKHFHDAAALFAQVQHDFPDSPDKDRYEFEKQLSEIRNRTDPFVTDAGAALKELDALVEKYPGSDMMKDYAEDIGQTYHRIADALVSSEELDEKTLGQAERALKRVKQFAPNDPIDAVVAKIAAHRERVAKEGRFAKLMKLLEEILRGGDTWDCIPRAERAVRDASRMDPDFAKDPRVVALLQQIRERMLSLVTWSRPGKSLAPLVEPMDPTVLVVPATVSPAAAGLEKEDVVFALARGVLYALSASRGGDLLWATRVGIDTTMLPVRLPATPYVPPSVLVLSTLGPDANFLTRRNAVTGEPLWHYRLSAPALGRPAVLDAGRTAYVPTYDGKIHEISVLEGKLLGWFDVHQALTVGPVHQEGTSLLYVPGDSRNIFVLDLKNHEKPCQAILESGHPAGSLRSEPIIVSRNSVREDRHKSVQHLPDYLVLNQADGLSSMTLKIFALPVTSSEQRPLLERKFNGWPWFPPAYDGERIVQVTDAGTLEVLGINQVGDEDQPLFVIEKDQLSKQGGATGRAQIVHTGENEYWILAHGELQRYAFTMFGGPGVPAQELVKMWTNPLRLGSPMHTSQVDQSTNTMVLVTQSTTLQTFMATAVNMDDGQIIWQRQLGFISQGDGVALGSESVALDQGGGLFAFDSTRPFRQLRRHLASTDAMRAPSQEKTLKATLLRDANGAAVYEIAASPVDDRFQLIIRRHEPGKNTEKTVSLHALPVGEPALGADDVFLMLATGDLYRQPLDGTPGGASIHWRASHAQEGAVGYVAVLANDELLVTDGTRGLMRYRWPAKQATWDLLTTTRSRDAPDSPELPARIVSTPLVLNGQAPNGELVVLVATADGKVTLLKDSLAPFKPHGWQQVRTWDMNGKITSGPFLCGSFVACVVDHRVLVRLNPQADKPVWTFPAPESIIGQPNIIGDYVVVADESGRYICLDPATGKEQRGRGHTIRAAAGPASMPIPYGADKVLAPLNDGTILQLPLSSFKRALPSF